MKFLSNLLFSNRILVYAARATEDPRSTQKEYLSKVTPKKVLNYVLRARGNVPLELSSLQHDQFKQRRFITFLKVIYISQTIPSKVLPFVVRIPTINLPARGSLKGT